MSASPRSHLRVVERLPAEELRPMLPVVVDEPFDSADHIFEVKWGGVRAIAMVEDGEVRLHGRNLRDLTPLYPEVRSLADVLPGADAVVDIEILAWGNESLPSFELLRPRFLQPDVEVAEPRRSPVIIQVSDLLALDGEWLIERPLVERRNALHERLRPNRVAQAADFVREHGIAFYDAVANHGLEGIIAKEKNGRYLPGEYSDGWREIRASQSDDFVIGGYSFGGGRRKDPISSLLLGSYRSGKLRFVGEVSIGCSDKEAKQLLNLLTPLHDATCPFVEAPIVPRFVYWCRIELACHIRFSEWGREGMLRFPIFVAPRPDVPPEECRHDAL